MQWLVVALSTLTGNVVAKAIEFFGERLAKRIAIVGAVMTATVTCFVAFYTAFASIIRALSLSIANQFIQTGIAILFTPTASAAIAAIAAGYAARLVMDWCKVKIAAMRDTLGGS
jgi:hypothetical protein